MWNTYHAKGLNSVVHMPDLSCVRVGLYDKTQKFLLSDMLWINQDNHEEAYRNIKRFGPHAEDGSYFEIDFCYFDFEFKMVFASDGESFVMELTPKHTETGVKRNDIIFYISPLILWGKPGEISASGNTLKVNSFTIEIQGERDDSVKIYTETLGVPIKTDSTVRLLCNISSKKAESFISEKCENHKSHAAASDGWLRDSSESIWKSLIWNTIYEPVKDRICVPVTRTWCTRNGKGFGSYVLFEWDTFFAGLMAGSISKQLAYQQLESIFAEITEAGMIPNFGSQRGGSPDRSQPPVGSYCVLKLYRQFGDIDLLKKYYPLLLSWNRWWFKHRDGNGDGLLEWGSDPIPNGIERGYFDSGNTHLTAMYESGLDNSPMYDDVVFNEQTHTLELNDVGLNALYALDCQSIAAMADELGKSEEAKLLREEYERVKTLMNSRMYDPEAGMYCNTHWNGEKDYRFSPTNFYPLLAGIADSEQIDAMVHKNLLDEAQFWGEYIIPSISKEQSAYFDQDYWRGRIWGPMNYLVYEGLRRAGKDEVSAKFAEKGLNLFMGEWEGENHIHENYNSITGDGDDKINADPFYTWGALLAYIPICEYIYVAPEGGICFGNMRLPGAKIEAFPMADALYSLNTHGGFSLKRNGKDFITSSKPMLISDYRVDMQKITFKANIPAKDYTVHTQEDITDVTSTYL
ncbi:MAG: hypothetical protein FWC13_03095 [Oscillospiraceae bacterium]|nr:hypothetical protein [Oscillospiraceae bacterium]